MSLPPELRLMIYDVLIREPTDPSSSSREADIVVLSDDHTALSSRVKSLLKVKDIRAELLSRLFAKYQFEWTGFDSRDWNLRWVSFKRYAIPFINNLTFAIHDAPRPHSRTDKPFVTTLKWMRWRSQRSHLYPWQLKSLTLRGLPRPYTPPGMQFPPWLRNEMERHDTFRYILWAPVVPVLDSLNITLRSKPRSKDSKAFLQRCADCGVEGKLGYWKRKSGGRLYYRLRLEGGQLIRTTD